MKIKGIAYAGGLVEDHAYFPKGLAIESSAIDIPSKIPLLFNHNSETVVGHAEATVDGGKIVINGEVYEDLPPADNIAATAKRGFPWQLSVGVAIDDWTEDSNGVFTVTKGALREVSITPIGADRKTSLEPINASATVKDEQAPETNIKIVNLSADLIIEKEVSEMSKASDKASATDVRDADNGMADKIAELEAKISELEAVNADLNRRLIEASIADAPEGVKKLILATAKTPEDAKAAYAEIVRDLAAAGQSAQEPEAMPAEPVQVQASATGATGDVKNLMLKAIKGGK